MWWYQRKMFSQTYFWFEFSRLFKYTPRIMISKKEVSTNFFRFNFFFDLNSCIFFNILLAWWYQRKKFPQISFNLNSWSFSIWILLLAWYQRKKLPQISFYLNSWSFSIWILLLAWWYQRKKFPKIVFDLNSRSFLIHSLCDDIKERSFHNFFSI